MPPALCLSPTILDHSFPREIHELDRAVESLGLLQELTENKQAFVLLTSALEAYQEMFEWENSASYALLNDVYRLITQWLLQPTYHVRTVTTESVQSFTPHPVPVGCEEGTLVELWKAETGKIYSIFQSKRDQTESVALACDCAFAGYPLGHYAPDATVSRFQLVGPGDLSRLGTFEKWVIPENIFNQSVGFADAKKNLHVIGGEVAKTPVGSHYKVRFQGATRSWVLDQNEDPVRERYLDELVPLSGFPRAVIRYALIFGQLPVREPLF